MSRMQGFFVFLSIIILLYGSINTYIFVRGLQVVPQGSHLRFWFCVIFWSLALSYFAARLVERVALSWFSDLMVWIGSFWLAAMACFFLFVLLIDILRLLNQFLPFFPRFIMGNIRRAREVTALIVVGVTLLTLIGGRINSMFPRIRTMELAIGKKSPLKELNVAVVSDIHLGTLVCNSHFMRIVDKINSLDPDIVLLAGDIVDEDIQPVIRQNLGETISRIKSRYGIYGITGNHEYIGGVEKACSYLTEHGVNMLRDTAVRIADAFVLVGREDVSIRQFTGKRRKPLAELMAGTDRSFPVILMDHQPLNLNDAVENGADLQVSGHTHNGQMWPFNYLAAAIYELSWGYKKKGNTHIYVSCGVGTWGPPVRTGNTPEVMNFKLKFE